MIFGFYLPFVGEAGWCGLPEQGENRLWTSAGEIPGSGIGAIAGLMVGIVHALGGNPPSAIFVAPDDGSGADFLREALPLQGTIWVSASEVEAQAALAEMAEANDHTMQKILEDDRLAVRKAAALAWRELRRIS